MEIMEILIILAKYMTEGQKEYPLWAEHDIIGFNLDEDAIKQMDLKDVYRLKDLGVFYSSEYDSLMMFV